MLQPQISDQQRKLRLAGATTAFSLLFYALSPAQAADVTGRILMDGPPGLTLQRLEFNGPSYKWTSRFGTDGSYTLTGLSAGTYRANLIAGSGYPYDIEGYYGSSGLSVADGANHIDLPFPDVGAMTGSLSFPGGWDAAAAISSDLYWAGPHTVKSAIATDNSVKIIGQAGLWQLNRIALNFQQSKVDGSFWRQSLNLSLSSTSSASGMITALSTSNAGSLIDIPSAEALMAFEAPDGNITKVEFHCGASRFTTCFADGDFSRVHIYGNILTGTPSSPVQMVKLRGIPGTYDIHANITTDTGAIYGTDLSVTMSPPLSTPEGSSETLSFTPSGSNEPVGSLNFNGGVSEAGYTTFTELSEGPDPQEGFAIFMEDGVPQYFDVSTTADFNGVVKICVRYDDSNLSLTEEQSLGLNHYVYDEVSKTGSWELITAADYPNTDTNEICGLTSSFSIFAIVETPDADGDGVANEHDNCPSTPNPDQADADGDNIGDLCEADSDADGLIDDIDLCPTLASDDNNDLDGDGLGDPCDDDVDGDGVANSDDNCPQVSNPDQLDFDFDAYGDVCDADADNDGVGNAEDFCAQTPLGADVLFVAPVELQITGCSSQQHLEISCPSTDEWRNHGQYMRCVTKEADFQVEAGLIQTDQRDDLVNQAARSDTGK